MVLRTIRSLPIFFSLFVLRTFGLALLLVPQEPGPLHADLAALHEQMLREQGEAARGDELWTDGEGRKRGLPARRPKEGLRVVRVDE